MWTRRLFALTLVVCQLSPITAEAPGTHGLDSFESISVLLKPTQGTNRKVRVMIGDTEHFYIHQASNLFPCREQEPVVIRRVRERAGDVDVFFDSPRLGAGQIRFACSGDLAVFRYLFWHAFAEQGTPIQAEGVIGNARSRVYHLKTSNHLPSQDERVELASTHLASTEGYRACSLCFKEFPRVSDFLLERQLGFQAAAQARILYPPVLEEAKQKQLKDIGERALSHWPHPLKGYDYSFTLVQSDVPNAFAVPGGKIFVTSAVYDMAESEAEIEAVLAHEIAHVEKRHGYRQYRSARRAAIWAAVGAGILGGVTAARTKSPTAGSDAAQIALALSELAAVLVLSGHSREYEEEADAYAGIYFESRSDAEGKEALLQSLRKIKYSDELYGRLEDPTGAFISHPGITERIEALEGSIAGSFPTQAVFQGFKESGELVGTVQLEMQRVAKNIAGGTGYEYGLLVTVYATAELGAPCVVRKLRVETAGRKATLENKEKTELRPLESVGALFEGTLKSPELLAEIQAIDLDLCSATRWVRVE